MDTLKSGWTHYVYYTTHLFSSAFCLFLWGDEFPRRLCDPLPLVTCCFISPLVAAVTRGRGSQSLRGNSSPYLYDSYHVFWVKMTTFLVTTYVAIRNTLSKPCCVINIYVQPDFQKVSILVKTWKVLARVAVLQPHPLRRRNLKTRRSFVSTVRPTVHSNLSWQQGFSKTLF